MKNFLLLIGFWCAIAGPAYAFKEYYALSRSVRALGMGGAFYALSDDESALHYNPAGLSQYPAGAQLMVSTGFQVSQGLLDSLSKVVSAANGSIAGGTSGIVNEFVSLSGNPISIGTGVSPYFLKRGFSLSAFAGDVKGSVGILGQGLETSVEATTIVDNGVLLGFSKGALNDQFQLGFTAKALYRLGGRKELTVLDLAEGEGLRLADLGWGGAGLDFDLGLLYALPSKGRALAWKGAVVLSNVMATNFTLSRIGAGAPGLPRTLSFGVQMHYRGNNALNNFRFAVDMAELPVGGIVDNHLGARGGSLFKHINFGMELPLASVFALRAGFHQGNWTAGFGIHAYLFKLDFATYGEELLAGTGRLTSRRYALRLAVGFGASGLGSARN